MPPSPVRPPSAFAKRAPSDSTPPVFTFPLPAVEAMEAAVATAIRRRDFEPALEAFWPLAAQRLSPEELASVAPYAGRRQRHRAPLRLTRPLAGWSRTFAELDEQWRALCQTTLSELSRVALAEIERIGALVGQAEGSRKGAVWTEARGALSEPAALQRADDALHRALLGDDYESDPTWLSQLNNWKTQGRALKSGWADWRVQQAVARALPATARNLDPERKIQESPADEGARRVYADWLEERDANLGELLSLKMDHSGEWKAELIRELGFPLGCLEPLLDSHLELEWPDGYFERATLQWHGPSPGVALELLLAHPASVALEALEISGSSLPMRSAEGPLAVLEAAGPRLLMRELALRSSPAELDSAALFRLYPGLEQLTFVAQRTRELKGMSFPKLRKLSLYSFDVAETCASLPAQELPSLVELQLAGVRWPRTQAVLELLRRFPRLERLHLRGVPLPPDDWPAVADFLRASRIRRVGLWAEAWEVPQHEHREEDGEELEMMGDQRNEAFTEGLVEWLRAELPGDQVELER